MPTWNQNTSGTAAGLSATLAVGSGGTGVTSITALKNVLDDETWTFANTTIFSGNVGIGNSSPSSYFVRGGGLVVDSVDAGSNVVILNDNNTFSSLFFAKGSTRAEKYQGYIEYEHANNIMTFGTAQVERIRILADGKVGIGTSSPGAKLEVVAQSDTVGGDGIILGNGSNREWITRFGTNTDLTYNLDFYDGSSWSNRFKLTYTGNATFSGNTSAFVVTARDNMFVDAGQLYIGADDGTTDDTFRQLVSSGAFKIQSRESGTWTDRFKIDTVGDVSIDNNLFIGSTKAIYIGGTSSPNALEDYEEGSWTPSLSTTGGSVGTASSAGQYTKIGRQVIVHFQFTLSSSSGGSGSLLITNLPFTVAANSGAVTGSGRILDLGQAIAVGHYTSTNQISIFKYNGNYAGTDFFTTGFVTYYVA